MNRFLILAGCAVSFVTGWMLAAPIPVNPVPTYHVIQWEEGLSDELGGVS